MLKKVVHIVTTGLSKVKWILSFLDYLTGRVSIPGRDNAFSYSTAYRPALDPTRSRTQWVPPELFPKIKRPGLNYAQRQLYNYFSEYFNFHVRWVPCHHSMARPQVADGGDSLQFCRVADNILNKQ
jgi:hypothetical protein